MGWGQGIGIGWPNASASAGPPPPPEKYFVVDCIGYRGDAETIEYPAGTFSIGDRVVYDAGGINTWGLVSTTASPQYTEIEIIPTGVNTNQCFDNTVIFNSYGTANNTNVAFVVEIQPQDGSFFCQDEEYFMTITYYASGYCIIDVGEGEVDERPFTITGYNVIENYDYSQYGEYEIVFANQNMGYPVIQVYTEYIAQQPEFSNTEAFTDNDCDNHYFLRRGNTQYGSTFYASFSNDDC